MRDPSDPGPERPPDVVVGAVLVGTLFAGQKTAEILDGFPGGWFLTLAGITWLFALAQNNGASDRLFRLAARAATGRIAASDEVRRALPPAPAS